MFSFHIKVNIKLCIAMKLWHFLRNIHHSILHTVSLLKIHEHRFWLNLNIYMYTFIYFYLCIYLFIYNHDGCVYNGLFRTILNGKNIYLFILNHIHSKNQYSETQSFKLNTLFVARKLYTAMIIMFSK